MIFLNKLEYLRVELRAEGRHLDALKEAFNQLLGLPCSMCTGPIVDKDRLLMAEAQILLDLAKEFTKIMLICTLSIVPNWLS